MRLAIALAIQKMMPAMGMDCVLVARKFSLNSVRVADCPSIGVRSAKCPLEARAGSFLPAHFPLALRLFGRRGVAAGFLLRRGLGLAVALGLGGLGRGRSDLERGRVVLDPDLDLAAVDQLAEQQFLGERLLVLFLEEAAH